MSNIKAIREHLKVTQQALATGIGCSQGNIGNYEAGQTFPPAAAKRLISFAELNGLRLSFEHIYGKAALPAVRRARKPPSAAPEPIREGA